MVCGVKSSNLKHKNDRGAQSSESLDVFVLVPGGMCCHDGGMAFRGCVDARLVHALGAMTHLSHAEAWRQLTPIAGRLGVRCPSYPTVRRALLEHRWLEQLRRARGERRTGLLADLLTGRVPYRWLHAVIVGTPWPVGVDPSPFRARPVRPP
jgi:hypothetical protein